MNKRRVIGQLLKIVVSIGLITILLYRISPGRLLESLSGLDPAWISAAFVIFIVSSILGAVQWYVLLSAGGVRLPFGKAVSLYLTGMFFNNLLPTNIGGDAYKIYDVARTGHDGHRVFAITLLDRIFGITGLCLLALAASLALYSTGADGGVGIYSLVFAGCIAPVVALTVSRRISSPLRRALSGIGLWRIGERLELIMSHLGSLRSLRPLLGRVIGLTILIQALRVLTHVAVALSLGIRPGGLEILHFFVYIPLLGLIMILPISINGLGIREGAGILLFTGIGFHEEQAFLMEFITYVVMVAVSLIGGLLLLRRQLAGTISVDKGPDSGV